MLALLATALIACRQAAEPAPPNILLIVADDLGYSDLGVYGGEIDTPNLDALAREGVMFTQFYSAPMCSPARAMLLTGVDHHRAGLGNLKERLSDKQRGQPGYEGHLNSRVVTLAELLRAAGYDTFMSGKWHLGHGASDPVARGFDRAFALMESGAGHFANMLPLLGPGIAEYSEDGVALESLPADFYSSRTYVRKLMDYLDQDRDSQPPFFAYLAFTAPHFPLQASRSTIDKYRGRYDEGYDAVAAARLKRMQAIGLIPQDVESFPQLSSETAWNDLDDEGRRREARRMEIYAAMIDDMDAEVGTLIRFLQDRDLYQNTLIVFLSDNGAEGHYLRWGLDPLAPWGETCCDNSLDNMGNADSYLMLGPSWARVSTAPFRMFKGFTSEGGVRVPAFVHFPDRVPGARQTSLIATVKDVLPTVLDIAGIRSAPATFDDRSVEPVQGRSLAAFLLGDNNDIGNENVTVAMEVFGKRGLRQGHWKIIWETADATWWDAAALGIKRNSWQLYDLEADPAELEDLAAKYPQRLEQMIERWEEYARDNGVIIPDRQRGY